MTAALLIALGTALPLLFAAITWTHTLIALALILVIRPLSERIALLKTDLDHRDRAVVSVYGVRGIVSLHYLCYAGSHMKFAN